MRRTWSVARTPSFVILLAAVPSVCGPRYAHAAWFESLVMPGEVIAKHARVERQCDKCHEPFDKVAQDRLCLSCHTDVATDLGERRGYHGQEPGLQSRPCRTCHTEHQGRGAAIVRLDRSTFEHRVTDYPLRGGHTRVACDNCHTPGKRYREAPTQCSSCHDRKDPHGGSLGMICASCHTETTWKTVRFDHATTAFPLEGRHRDARCEGCHTTKRYKPTATTCVACHERDDKHHGSLGGACQSCHTPRKWAVSGFDHVARAHFPLSGRHARVACQSCHSIRLVQGGTPTTCQGCHERDDAHNGQFGHACETCHTPVDWQRHTFEHDRRTRFPLRGRHGEIRCTDCHHGDRHEERLTTSCYSCHRDDDVHDGREGTHCDNCHDERGWHRDVLFDHGSTRFPLLGAHARVACTQCHVSPSFKDVAHECAACHQNADVHRGGKGPACGDCHNHSTWQLPRVEGRLPLTPNLHPAEEVR